MLAIILGCFIPVVNANQNKQLESKSDIKTKIVDKNRIVAITKEDFLTLKRILKATGKKGWLKGKDKIQTNGVRCDSFTYMIKCDEAGHIISLELSSLHGSGSFPKEVLQLLHLKSLSIGDASFFSGPIPIDINRLKRLEYLSLRGTSIGKLPSALFTMTQLKSLKVHNYSRLPGIKILPKQQPLSTIPGNIDRLVNLQTLEIWGDNFTGVIPDSIGQLAKLKKLSIRGTNIKGVLPSKIGALIQLQELVVENNPLIKGKIPRSFSKLTKLQMFSLRYNGISGSITEIFSAMKELEVLYLNHNQFMGEFPDSIRELKRRLYSLNLSNNKLRGVIPRWIRTLNKLEFLTISNNQFTGSIPDTLYKLTQLKILDMGYNKLSGSIPSTIGQMRKLETLSFSHNHLAGQIPISVKSLGALMTLNVSHNEITGPIPVELFQLGELTTINLSHNRLTGKFPVIVGGNEYYKRRGAVYGTWLTLNVSHNQLTGVLPRSIFKIKFFWNADFSNNRFKGKIPVTPKGMEVGKLNFENQK